MSPTRDVVCIRSDSSIYSPCKILLESVELRRRFVTFFLQHEPLKMFTNATLRALTWRGTKVLKDNIPSPPFLVPPEKFGAGHTPALALQHARILLPVTWRDPRRFRENVEQQSPLFPTTKSLRLQVSACLANIYPFAISGCIYHYILYGMQVPKYVVKRTILAQPPPQGVRDLSTQPCKRSASQSCTKYC